MPEIAIKQTLNDAQFKRGLSESAANVKQWGREAQQAFDSTRTPAERYSQDLARLDKLHRDGYVSADTYCRRLEQIDKTIAGSAAKAATGPVNASEGVKPSTFDSLLGASGLSGITVAATMIAGAEGALKLAESVGHAAEESHRLAIAAEQVDISIHSFEALSLAGRRAGVDVATITTNVLRLSKAVGEAAAGDSSKSGAFRQIGIDPSELFGKDPESAFQAVANALSKVENKFARTRIEMELFGRGGAQLDVVLKQIANGGLDKLKGEVVPEHLRKELAALGEHADVLEQKWMVLKRTLQGEIAMGINATMGWKPEEGPSAEQQGRQESLSRIELQKQKDKATWDALHRDFDHQTKRAEFIEKNKPDDFQLKAYDERAAKEAEHTKYEDNQKRISQALDRTSDSIAKYKAELKGLPAYQAELDKLGFKEGEGADVDKINKLADAMREEAALAKQVADQKAEVAKKEADQKKEEDRKTRLAESADKFESSMLDEFMGRQGETSKEAQLRHLVSQGLDKDRAMSLAMGIAGMDAEDEVKRSGKVGLASAAGYGSREAYEMIAKSRGVGDSKEDRQARVAEASREHLEKIELWLSKLYQDKAEVAQTP